MSHEDYDAVSTVKSLAYMLGWENVPPREVLERSLNALRHRLAAVEKEAETWSNRAAIAEPNVHRLQTDAHKLEMERNQARDERDEIRAELKDWMKSYPPSICSAHKQVNLECGQCNPAIRQVGLLTSALRVRIAACDCGANSLCRACGVARDALQEVSP